MGPRSRSGGFKEEENLLKLQGIEKLFLDPFVRSLLIMVPALSRFLQEQEQEIHEGESTGNLKSAIKIRTTSRLSYKFQNDTRGLNSGRQVAARYYVVR